MKAFAILISLFFTTFAYADLQRDAGKIECRDDVQRCTYITQNLTARVLLSRLEAVLKPGDIITPKEGYVNVEGLKVLSFWFFNTELKTRFEALLPLLDVLEDGVPTHLVQLTTEIYSMSDEGLKHVDVSITNAGGDAQDGPDWDITDITGALDLNLNVGTKLLSMLLSGKVTRKETSRVTRVVQLIPNLAGINYKRTTKIYISPTAGSVKEEEAGLTIGGTVSINASDKDLVTVKDYSFKYGVLNPGGEGENDQVTILSISNPQLYLYKDVNSMIVSSHTATTTSERGFRFLGFGKSKTKTYSKLMVVTRARAIDFEDYKKEMKKYASLSMHKEFKDVQVDNMPAQSKVNMKTVLESLTPYAYMNSAGNRIVGFRLDPKYAAQNNIKKTFEIKVKGGGTKYEKSRSIENLMLSGFLFDSFSDRYLDKDTFKIKLKFKQFKTNFRFNKTLYYDPERNKFITE